MTDKEIVERAKEAEKRTGFGELVHSPISKGVNSAFGMGFIEGMVEYRNSLQEELGSEGFEEAIEQSFIYHENRGDDFRCDEQIETSYRNGFEAGANWQKEQMMKESIDGEIQFGTVKVQKEDIKEAVKSLREGEKVKLIVIKK